MVQTLCQSTASTRGCTQPRRGRTTASLSCCSARVSGLLNGRMVVSVQWPVAFCGSRGRSHGTQASSWRLPCNVPSAGANPVQLNQEGLTPLEHGRDWNAGVTPRSGCNFALCERQLEAAAAAAPPELRRVRKAAAACGHCGKQEGLKKCGGWVHGSLHDECRAPPASGCCCPSSGQLPDPATCVNRRLRNAVRLLLSQPCNVCQPPELPCALPPSSSVHSCELAWFCSPECQKQAWPGHKQR